MTVTSISAPLQGKVAVVTGASRGIGAETVYEFARKGASHIAITYHTASNAAEEVSKAARAINPDLATTTIQADVKDPEFGKKVISGTLTGLGVSHIDIMVSNAALQDITDLPNAADTTKENFDMVFTAQTWAPLQLSMEVIKVMPAGGRIILNSSGSSKMPMGDPYILHCASKAAMDAIARSLGFAYGKSNRITVNSISIGATATDSLEKVFEHQGGDAMRAYAANLSPLNRIGSPKEVASIIGFVASPEASWINGNQIPANGGAMATLQG